MSSNASKEPAYLKQELKEEDVSKLLKIIETVQKDNMAFDFLEPVDYQGLGLYDYPKIITHPMDIGTLKSNLEKGEYKTFQDFSSDLNLIWKNCRTYNLPGSEIVKMANHCDKKFKQLMEKQFKNYQSSSKGGNAANKKNNNNESANSGNNGLTLAEKTKLIEAIREQSNEGLTQVVKIILKECPKGIEDIDNEKLQIKIDLLDHRTYELINNYFEKAGNTTVAAGAASGGNNNNAGSAEKNKTPKK